MDLCVWLVGGLLPKTPRDHFTHQVLQDSGSVLTEATWCHPAMAILGLGRAWLANLTAILYANSYGVSMCFIFNELGIWKIFKKDKKGLHDLSVMWQRHSNMKHMKPCGIKKNSSRMIFQLYTGQSILFVGQLLWCKAQSWKEAVWSLLYECGRREEHRSDICHMLRFHGYPSTFSDLWRQVGSVTVLRPFESCLCC